jgi:hypothetical protein
VIKRKERHQKKKKKRKAYALGREFCRCDWGSGYRRMKTKSAVFSPTLKTNPAGIPT